MRYLILIILGILTYGITPSFSSAALACNDGVSIYYINGILSEGELVKKRETDLFRNTLRNLSLSNQNVVLELAHNQSRGYIADGAQAFLQYTNQGGSAGMYDPDLFTILAQLHSDVKTSKLILVGHSQGTLYANAVAEKLVEAGMPRESLGVYNIATPAHYVFQNSNNYLTSSNDAVINLVRRQGIPTPLPANVTIPLLLGESGPWAGHSFVRSYLDTEGSRIIKNMDSIAANLVHTNRTECVPTVVPTLNERLSLVQSHIFTTASRAAETAGTLTYSVVTTTFSILSSALTSTANIIRSTSSSAMRYFTPTVPSSLLSAGSASAFSLPPATALSGTAVYPGTPARTVRVSIPTQPIPTISLTTLTVSPTLSSATSSLGLRYPSSENLLVPPPPVSKLIPTFSYPGFGGGGASSAATGTSNTAITSAVSSTTTSTSTAPSFIFASATPLSVSPPTFSIHECLFSFTPDTCTIATTTLSISEATATHATLFSIFLNDSFLATTTSSTFTLFDISDASTHTVTLVGHDATGTQHASTTLMVRTFTQPLVISEILWAPYRSGIHEENIFITSRSNQFIEITNRSPFPFSLANSHYITEIRADASTIFRATTDTTMAPGLTRVIAITDSVLPRHDDVLLKDIPVEGATLELAQVAPSTETLTLDSTPPCTGWCRGLDQATVVGNEALQNARTRAPASMSRIVGAIDGTTADSWYTEPYFYASASINTDYTTYMAATPGAWGVFSVLIGDNFDAVWDADHTSTYRVEAGTALHVRDTARPETALRTYGVFVTIDGVSSIYAESEPTLSTTYTFSAPDTLTGDTVTFASWSSSDTSASVQAYIENVSVEKPSSLTFITYTAQAVFTPF
jgi:hypothetical protein